jgi:hypothetical protein
LTGTAPSPSALCTALGEGRDPFSFYVFFFFVKFFAERDVDRRLANRKPSPSALANALGEPGNLGHF